MKTEDGRNYQRNRQHLRVCLAPGSDSDDQTVTSACEREFLPGYTPEQPAGDTQPVVDTQPAVDVQPAVDTSLVSSPPKLVPPVKTYVTRSGRSVVKPKRFGY